MEVVLMLGGLMLAVALIGVSRLFALPRLWREWQEFQLWRVAQAEPAQAPAVLAPVPGASLPGAALALAEPPRDLQRTLQWIRAHEPDDHYVFPAGWYRNSAGVGAIHYGSFVGDTNHILITGQSDVGKDNLALNILFTLTQNLKPQQLQVALIDGKGLDFVGWADRMHTWGLALKPAEIAPMMQRLSKERERRQGILAAAGVSKWDNYKRDLPLLVVYISELSLLEDAVGKTDLTAWLNSELAAGRAFGIRYIVATQTASNFATRWRSQIGLYLAGFQPSDSQDQPNTGLTTKELKSFKSVPPSELPAPPSGSGVFTAIHGREAMTVRCSLLSDEQRRAWLQRMPARPVPIPTVAAALPETATTALESPAAALIGTATTTAESAVVSAPAVSPRLVTEPVVVATPATLDVSAEECKKILELKATGLSGRKIEEAVYGFSGGKAYAKVRAVLEAAERQVNPTQTVQAA